MNTTHELCKLIIVQCLNPKYPINWPREIKIAKKLVARNGDFAFWKQIELKYKPSSLSYFLTDEGKMVIDRQESRFAMAKEKASEILDSEKLGDDRAFVPTKQSLLDFIRK